MTSAVPPRIRRGFAKTRPPPCNFGFAQWLGDLCRPSADSRGIRPPLTLPLPLPYLFPCPYPYPYPYPYPHLYPYPYPYPYL